MDNTPVIELNSYKFNSLNQYLRSVETKLRASNDLEQNLKILEVRKCIGEFFKKLRFFRNKTLEEVCSEVKIDLNDLEAFESGLKSIDKNIEFELARHYKAESHYLSLYQKSLDIKNKVMPDERRDLAISLWKQFGILPDGVTTKDLKKESYGQVLTFPKL